MDSKNNCEAAVSLNENSCLLLAQSTIQPVRRKFNCRCIKRTYLGYLSFVLLLVWQIVGSVLYFMRAYYCCIQERHTSFRCSNFATFPHSQELELAWLISQDVCIAIFVFSLSTIPGFLGYSVIFRRATRLPAFWTLTMLKIMEVIGFCIIIHFNNLTTMQICLVVNFCVHGMSLICIMCVLNFTPINPVKNSCSSLALVFCKLTLAILFVQTFVIFIIGSVQFAFKVTGLDDMGRSANFVTVFRKLREFPQVIFYYRAMAFFFHKLFMDNKNILSHCQYLRIRNDPGEDNPI